MKLRAECPICFKDCTDLEVERDPNPVLSDKMYRYEPNMVFRANCPDHGWSVVHKIFIEEMGNP